METGPVDVYIIGFPGNKFTGRIAPAIRELVDNGTIRVLDLLFVMKDEDGVVTTIAIEDLDQEGAAFAEIDVTEPGSLNEEDADEVSDDLPPNSSALLVAFENGELAVHGRRAASHPDKSRATREFEVTGYFRSFRVAEQIAADKIEAALKNGVLTLHLPKVEAVKPRRIAVKG